MSRATTNSNRRDADTDPQKAIRVIKKHSLAIVLILLFTIIAVFVVWAWVANSLSSPDNFYVLPRTADDWSGWGTAVGALGTSGALIYAALKFRQDAEEQRTLRLDRDAAARADATPLAVDVRLTYPDQTQDVDGLRLILTNTGKKQFSNIRVKIPDVPAQVISAESAPIPTFNMQDEEGHAWANMNRPHQVDGQFWLCGDVGPGTIVSLTVVFDDIQSAIDWDQSTYDHDTGRGERDGRIAVTYDDYRGRTWVRSTEGRQPLQRIWPDDFAV